MTEIARIVSCMDGYDPDALRVDLARQAILAFLSPIEGTERVAVRAALGRVLAQEVVPSINVPAFQRSAMDGFALRAADLKPDADAALKEIGTAYAGRAFSGPVGAGECVRIMTGAVMPEGTDTVVIQELAKAEGKTIHIPAGQEPGQHRRLAGEDLKKGSPALRAGTLVRPADLGLIASLGLAEVRVRRRLRVAFFSTGDEVASIGQALAPGQIYDSNRYTLYGLLRRLGAEVIDLGVVRDRPEDRQRNAGTPWAALAGVGQILRQRHTAGILALSLVGYASYIALRGLWAAPLLVARHGFSLTEAGHVLLASSLAALLGAPLFGHIRAGAAARRRWIVAACLLTAVAFAGLAAGGPWWLDAALCVLVGLLAGFSVLQFADAKEAYPREQAGRAFGVFNTVSFLGVALVQWATGLAAGAAAGAAADPFAVAFLLVAASLAAGVLAFAVLPRPPACAGRAA